MHHRLGAAAGCRVVDDLLDGRRSSRTSLRTPGDGCLAACRAGWGARIDRGSGDDLILNRVVMSVGVGRRRTVKVLPIEKRSLGFQFATSTTGPPVTLATLRTVLSTRTTGPKLPREIDAGLVVSRIVLPSTVMLAGLVAPMLGPMKWFDPIE